MLNNTVIYQDQPAYKKAFNADRNKFNHIKGRINEKKYFPSLLSANFANLTKDIKTVEDLGVTRLHLDVMDGHFVPNLLGPFIISQIRATTKLHLETHLMIC